MARNRPKSRPARWAEAVAEAQDALSRASAALSDVESAMSDSGQPGLLRDRLQS